MQPQIWAKSQAQKAGSGVSLRHDRAHPLPPTGGKSLAQASVLVAGLAQPLAGQCFLPEASWAEKCSHQLQVHRRQEGAVLANQCRSAGHNLHICWILTTP